MSTAGLLARGRAAALIPMTDTCAITRTTVGAISETTGAYETTSAAVYSGACRVKPAHSATVDAAGIAVDASRPLLEIPWTATGAVLPGDVVAIDSGPMSGTTAEVFAEVVGSTSTKRAYTLEVQS